MPATLADLALIQAMAEQLVDQANKVGAVVTIDLQSLQPLRMGHYEPVIRVWPANPNAKTGGQ
ncbi:hypothetical protein SNE35_22735 [Paucibacter sp. R3-3]|uniref:Uncharacterized protein n=1 Tax=Roseateles agri TaxID=3098619 RepID=A0ABU5DM05_9BURK|nr:hypothetical protein [Paucibacter sp. R3-3]MDY0747337.1 hypothetical protein [Paucibacter sp. R3-3]